MTETLCNPICRPWRRWGAVQGIAGVALLIVVAAGWVPTGRSAGTAGVHAMGCAAGITWCVSGMAMLLVLLWKPVSPAQFSQTILAAGAIRFIMVLLIVLPIVFLDVVPTVSFLVWVGISYLTVLAADTIVLVYWLNTPRNQP